MRRVNLLSLLAALVLALAGGLPVAVPAEAASVNSLALRATYNVTASFSWATRAVSVRTVARVTNPTASSVSTIAFNLATLRTGAANVGTVRVRGSSAAETINGQTVLVPISPALSSGDVADVEINYNATLRSNGDGYNWEFTRANGVMTAYRWIPWLSRSVRFSNPAGGESWVTPNSSYVRVVITTDQLLVISSSGERLPGNGLTQVFEARNVRDFNFSAAPDYQTASRTTNGTTITWYYRTLPSATVLDWTVTAFNTFSDSVGDYPYSYLNLAEIGPWGSLESPGLFWITSNPGSLFRYDVVHEVAHMWFYSTVGNDQAVEPFADEAVAEFLSREVVANPWSSSKCLDSRLDRTIYTKPGSCYFAVVYYQGYKYLDAYRDHVKSTVGESAFWQGLKNYYQANKFGMGGTRKLLDALDAATGYHPNHAARFPSLYP